MKKHYTVLLHINIGEIAESREQAIEQAKKFLCTSIGQELAQGEVIEVNDIKDCPSTDGEVCDKHGDPACDQG